MKIQRLARATLAPLMILAIFGTAVSALRAADASGGKVLFEDNFAGTLDKGWAWYNELPDHWKIDKEKKELVIQPVWAVGNMKNVLLRTPPTAKEGALAIEVHIEHVTTGDYEYSGLIWYFDDKNFVSIRKGPHGEEGNAIMLVLRKAGEEQWVKLMKFSDTAFDLRMVVGDGELQAAFRATGAADWQSLGETPLPSTGPAKVGFRTGNGDGPKPSSARFSKFRILQLDR